MPLPKIRLLIVDDHAVVREGLQAMLSIDPNIEAIETAASVADVKKLCPTFAPHIMLLDVRMPHSDGFTVLQGVQKHWPDIRIIMLSASATPAEVKLARQHGASGYLSKSSPRATLLEAIFAVNAGETRFQTDKNAESSETPSLSARELEVLRHLGRGLSNEDLGRALGVSAETVKSHLKAVFAKLDVAGRAEAVTRGYELGILSVQ
ncbi:MAG: response regulator transcription factor [Verrucomicrobiota bacterium]